jgi:hypothetical protein
MCRFCPEELKENAFKDPANRDCLVRVYLGKRQAQFNPKSGKMFTLRNFNLTLNHIECLNVDPRHWADQIGHSLAILHWEACVDAHDVEFVLGSSPSQERAYSTYAEVSKLSPRSQTKFRPNFKRRMIDLWVLDFNNCSQLNGTKDEIDHMVWAFYWNDPYFPLPEAELSDDKALWYIFCKSYLDKSAKILELQPEKRRLPEMFIDAVVKREQQSIKEGHGHGYREQRD